MESAQEILFYANDVDVIGIDEAPWKKDDPRLQQLYAYRRDRTVLHCDDKILLSWNCWMIMAMIQAGMVLEEPSYSESALRAMEFLSSHMISKNDRLCLRYRDGDASYDGQLEDYALFALAGLSLYRWTGDSSYLQQALHRARQMIELFEDPAGGGYYRSAEDGETLIMRTKELNDGAMELLVGCHTEAAYQHRRVRGEVSHWVHLCHAGHGSDALFPSGTGLLHPRNAHGASGLSEEDSCP